MEPTDRSMPPVRMTKVMPAASTMLIDDCWVTINRLVSVRKRGFMIWKPAAKRIRTGSMPSAAKAVCSRRLLPTAWSPALISVALSVIPRPLLSVIPWPLPLRVP
jgi:hypothetical protein